MDSSPITTTVRAVSTPQDWIDAAALLDDYVTWIRDHAGYDPHVAQPAFVDELDDLAHYYAAPLRALFLGFVGARAAGTVAVHQHAGPAAELKRMFVSPDARGRGLADRLVTTAIEHASRSACSFVWLETVRGAMDPAVAVYRRNGFTQTDRPPTLAIPGTIVMHRRVDAGDEPNAAPRDAGMADSAC